MENDEKAKLLLFGEKVIELEELYQFVIADKSYIVRDDMPPFREENYFIDEGEVTLAVEINLKGLFKARDYVKINKARKAKVVLIDEFNNIVD